MFVSVFRDDELVGYLYPTPKEYQGMNVQIYEDIIQGKKYIRTLLGDKWTEWKELNI